MKIDRRSAGRRFSAWQIRRARPAAIAGVSASIRIRILEISTTCSKTKKSLTAVAREKSS
jgi:hypothetical protein